VILVKDATQQLAEVHSDRPGVKASGTGEGLVPDGLEGDSHFVDAVSPGKLVNEGDPVRRRDQPLGEELPEDLAGDRDIGLDGGASDS